MPKKLENIVGHTFNRLTCITRAGKHKYGWNLYLCRCECGKEKIVSYNQITSGSIKSCGCLRKEQFLKTFTTHGFGSRSHPKRFYYTLWQGMKDRCYNPNNKHYSIYGGKGIRVFSNWKASFPEFYDHILKELGERPSKKYSLDRIDGAKNYEPGNLRWATSSTQGFNQTSKGSALGVRGVYKTGNSFYALLTVDGKRKYLGSYKTVEEAVAAYKKACLELRGELPPNYK